MMASWSEILVALLLLASGAVVLLGLRLSGH